MRDTTRTPPLGGGHNTKGGVGGGGPRVSRPRFDVHVALPKCHQRGSHPRIQYTTHNTLHNTSTSMRMFTGHTASHPTLARPLRRGSINIVGWGGGGPCLYGLMDQGQSTGPVSGLRVSIAPIVCVRVSLQHCLARTESLVAIGPFKAL